MAQVHQGYSLARLFRWHGYEEVEHKAVLFDVFYAARGDGLYTYVVRITGLWIAVVLVALTLPSVCFRVLASAGAAYDFGAWRDLIRYVFGRDGMLHGRWRGSRRCAAGRRAGSRLTPCSRGSRR